MTYLHDKLDSLYSERADLLEQIQRQIADPDLAGRVRSAANSPARGTAAVSELLMATMPTHVAIDRLKQEIAWVEKQILAILGNPALVEAGDGAR